MTNAFRRSGKTGSSLSPKGADADASAVRYIPWLSRDWSLGLLLIAAVVLTYSPVWHAGFIWDDDDHVTANPCIIGPLGLKEIWTTSNARYYPLVLTTFWFEHKLWGLAPLPYHLVNVLMHGACAVVLWRTLRSLQVPGAWLGAALWALHPVQVETVSWVTELKNTQSCLFYLLSILCFIRWLRTTDRNDRKQARRQYGLTLLFAALAMTSKSSTVVLPVELCLCAWWVQGRWHARNLVWLTPVFLMSVAAAILAMWSVHLYGDTHDPQWVQSWPARIVTSGKVFWFYLFKLLWPHPLVFIYPRWTIAAGNGLSYLPFLAAVGVMAVLWVKRGSGTRPYFFALVYFLVALLPVLGWVEHYFLRFSFVADHLQYLASIGPLALLGAGISRGADYIIPTHRALRLILCAGFLLCLMTISWQRTWAYQSSETLWADTLSQNPQCWIAHGNLGEVFFKQGQLDRAMAEYREALQINPRITQTYFNLGLALIQKGRVDEAIDQFREALAINPNISRAHDQLGLALIQKGREDEAMGEFREALKINPNNAEASDDLGWELLQKGQADEAMTLSGQVLASNPNDPDAHTNLGIALLQKGQINDAIAQFKKVVQLNPGDGNAQKNLASAEAMLQQPSPPK